ncbi:hypothetical protein RRF57_002461 [Xylaria bambusicola]|uniref:Uncharacterized protein n=1 Tax=Xylaria bambusicola TaxID=326684 RepID=A0AAN7UIS4_9PEZI
MGKNTGTIAVVRADHFLPLITPGVGKSEGLLTKFVKTRGDFNHKGPKTQGNLGGYSPLSTTKTEVRKATEEHMRRLIPPNADAGDVDQESPESAILKRCQRIVLGGHKESRQPTIDLKQKTLALPFSKQTYIYPMTIQDAGSTWMQHELPRCRVIAHFGAFSVIAHDIELSGLAVIA